MKARGETLLVYALGLGGLLWINIRCWLIMTAFEREQLGAAFWVAWIGLCVIFGLPVLGLFLKRREKSGSTRRRDE